MDRELILGAHSIYEALKNTKRQKFKFWCTDDGRKTFQKKYADAKLNCEVQALSTHNFQEKAQELFRIHGFDFQRIPTQILLEAGPTPIYGPEEIRHDLAEKKNIRIICLDQITDVHNAAAILRTSAFFKVDFVVTAVKGGFGVGPNFTRISSGALEYVKLVRCSSLPKFLTQLKSAGFTVIGLSEEASGPMNEEFISQQQESENKTCLVVGAEETGLSHAVERILDINLALIPQGQIRSLNVSVAAALAMQKFFTKIN